MRSVDASGVESGTGFRLSSGLRAERSNRSPPACRRWQTLMNASEATMSNTAQQRSSAIGIAFPQFAPALARWREPSLPAAMRAVPPHITLLGPWRPAPLTPGDIVAVRKALAGIEPFRLTFRAIERFPSRGVLYLRPEPDAPLRELIQRLARAFPETPPYGGAVADPVPHLTIAASTPAADMDRLQDEITRELGRRLPLDALVREITIAEQQTDGTWIAAHRLPFVASPP